MSDNDFTSGDPWGLSSTGTEEAPPAPPPVPNPVSDELPEDLADLSTIADPDVAELGTDIDGVLEESLTSLSNDDDSHDADASVIEPLDAEVADTAGDLDLGDFGNFSDLASDGDLGPLEISDLADDLEVDADSSTDLTVDALADLSSLSADFTEATANDEPAQEKPSPSAGRPLNPLLAASGLFGGSPSLPPLKDSEPDPADTDLSFDTVADNDDSDLSIQVGEGDIDFDAIELSAQPDLADFDLPDVGMDGVDMNDVDMDGVDIDTVEIDAPADIEAELADTLNALGDQPAHAITFSSDGSPSHTKDDHDPSVFDGDTAPIEEVTEEEVTEEEATAEAENFYPEFMSLGDTDESAKADADKVEPVEIGFGDTDFTTQNPPPAVYHELENLGNVDDTEATEMADSEADESASEFGAIFGGSTPVEDDPFGAVFGSGDAAIDAVTAAASSIETTHQTGPVERADNPTVDDLPDFLIDDDTTDDDSTDSSTDGAASLNATELGNGSGDESTDESTHESIDELVAEPVDSVDDESGETPSSWLGFGDSEAAATGVDDDDDEEAIDDDLADDGLDAGDVAPAFTAGEMIADVEVEGSLDEASVDTNNVEDDGVEEDNVEENSVDEGSVNEDLSESSIDPLPPMRDVNPTAFDADPFANPAVADLMKVDAADLDAGPPAFDVPVLAAVADSADEEPSPDFASTDSASLSGPGHAPIIGTVATGVIEKKPIPEDWGTRSDDAYEGWVQDDSGVETWRMIITNLPTVAGYDIDEFLGLAVADSLIVSHDVEAVASGRRAAIDALTEDGVLRGAHAIVAVTHAVQSMGNQMLVTVSGTAVTLKPTATAQAD